MTEQHPHDSLQDELEALADELDTALATLSAGALTATPVGERWTDYA